MNKKNKNVPFTALAIDLGITKREWFAGMALQGFLAANPDITPYSVRAAAMAFKYADAMLAESGKS